MLERTKIQWVSLALVTIAVACSGSTDDDGSSSSSAASASSSGAGGDGSSGGSRAAAVTSSSLHCDGGGPPSGDPTDLRVIIDQDPFVCKSPCETVFYGDLDIDCDNDWRLHVHVPGAPGVYDVGAAATASVWLISGVDPQNPAACASHNAASGTVEITKVSDVEVVGVVSNVSIDGAPGVDPNGPFTAPRCD